MFLLPPDRPALMGILNITPDSFSDGGVHYEAEAAIEAGIRMVGEGADLLDVGGESTRPGAEAVSLDEEIRRIKPVVEGLTSKGLAVSIDTSKPEVARVALDCGAQVVNDVTALSAEGMAEVCAASGCTVCLMHMQGEPRTMQQNPAYEDVVAEIRDFLLARAACAEAAGIARENIWIDPGIGFGKNLQHNLSLLKRLSVFTESPYPVLLGASRKSFLGRIIDPKAPAPPEDRLEGTLAVQILGQAAGVRIIRAHDVKQSRRAIDAAAAILNAS